MCADNMIYGSNSFQDVAPNEDTKYLYPMFDIAAQT